MQRLIIWLTLTIALIASSVDTKVQAQSKSNILTGIVVDSISQEPIPYAAIAWKGASTGTLADESGMFTLARSQASRILSISTLGYDTKDVAITIGNNDTIKILLVPSGIKIKELLVKPKREKYSKKNNPAVAFVEKLRARRDLNDPRKNHDYYCFDKYEKTTCALNDFDKENKSKGLYKKFQFIFDYIDTSEISGKPILNLIVKEKVSSVQHRREPQSEKEIVKGTQQSGIDEMVDQESIKEFLSDILREVDIFNNDVTILQNRFVSPLSHIATDFYKFYLSDTINIGGERCIELSFAPHNPESFGFLGRIYVPLADSTMFIKRVKLLVPKSINLNYVENMYLVQDYVKASDGSRLKVDDDIVVEFKIIQGTQGFYARKFTAYTGHTFNAPSELKYFSSAGKQIVLAEAGMQPEEFWRDNRQVPIKESESYTKQLLARLREVPLFYWSEKVLVALVTGYIPTRTNESKFDIGPMNTTFNGNALEGFRMRAGGITTANLNENLFARGYAAYGFKDHKWKYDAELEYSFNKKNYHSREFPIHSIKAEYKYDVDQLGQHYLFTNADNVFLLLKRKKNDKLTYQRLARLEYTYEDASGFSIKAGMNHEQQISTIYLPFITGNGDNVGRYTEAGFDVTLRYAPGEKFYQTKTTRYPINLDAPIFTLKQTYSPKGFMGSMYTINKTELSIQKRFWFSAFGYTDIILKGAKLWSEVAYPNLLLPNANLSYTIQPESFSLMNAMEFVNDKYFSWDLTYWANGAILNRIPVVKYLKFREVFSFRGIMGDLDKKNNPEYNSRLFAFPSDALCQRMNKTPYMECGVGLDNILTFLRLDYVWRLSYRNNPGVDKSGLRIQLHFTF